MNTNPTAGEIDHDPKGERTVKAVESPVRFCDECRKFLPAHGAGCSKATVDDYGREMARAQKDEQWARKRARHWLGQCRLMHGKIAMLKHENNKLRRKIEDREEPQF